MFITDATMWQKIADFAQNLGNPADFVSKAKRDFDGLLSKCIEIRRAIGKKFDPRQLNASISINNFHSWFQNLCCFYILTFCGFRHAALRELRFYLEASARCYYVDRNFGEKNVQEKKEILRIFKEKRMRLEKDLLKDLKTQKRREVGKFYNELCDYVHLSEESQTDALKDFSLNILLSHPEYEKDREMFEKTLDYSSYLLSQCLGSG